MDEFSVSTDIDVRFRDTDAMAHVNNAVYATYLEVARQTYWNRVAPEALYNRVPFVVARVSIDFRSPLRVGEAVRVQLRTSWVSRSSFGMEYELREIASGRLIAQASTVQVTFDYERDRAMPMPDELRRRLQEIEGHPLPDKPRGA